MATSEEQSGLLKPGQIIRPVLTAGDVPGLVARLFGLTVVSVKQLNSYDDKNFLIQVESKSNNPHVAEVCPDGYVLKVTNSMDSKNHGLMDSQNQMMLFLHGRGVCVPRPERNVKGTHMILEKMERSGDAFVENNAGGDGSAEYMVRLLTFIPGQILHQVPYTPHLLYQVGAFAARVDNELKDFKNEVLSKRQFIWMLDQTPELRKFSFAVRDEGRSQVISEVLDAWDKDVVPLLPKLGRGMIHGDFNEQNILVTASPQDPTTKNVTAILDFGDIQESCWVFEVAIAVMYMMIEVEAVVPNDAGGHVLAGYLSRRTLTEDEWSVLRECVAARFAQSLVMGAYSYEQDPGNEYLLVTAKKGWDVLTAFWRTPKSQVIARWKEIINSYND